MTFIILVGSANQKYLQSVLCDPWFKMLLMVAIFNSRTIIWLMMFWQLFEKGNDILYKFLLDRRLFMNFSYMKMQARIQMLINKIELGEEKDSIVGLYC